jgi:hypothetical protein
MRYELRNSFLAPRISFVVLDLAEILLCRTFAALNNRTAKSVQPK